MSNISPLTVTQYCFGDANGEKCSCLYSFCVLVSLVFTNAYYVFHVIVLSWNNSPCLWLCTKHMPSLSVPQPFMSLGRRRWWCRRESYSVSTVQLWNEQDCVFHIHVCWQPSLSLGVQFQLAAAFQSTQKYGEEEAVLTDYQWVVFCLLTSQTPHHHPLPFSLPPTSGLFHNISPSITGTQLTDLEHNYIIDKLQWQVL